MDHKELKRISLLLIDDELTNDVKSAADLHLSECESCRSYVQNLELMYSNTDSIMTDIKTDPFFYTRLIARIESQSVINQKSIKKESHFLQPLFYTLFAFTLIISLIFIFENINNKNQTNTSSNIAAIQSGISKDQEYLNTLAFNESTFEEDYINIIDK